MKLPLTTAGGGSVPGGVRGLLTVVDGATVVEGEARLHIFPSQHVMLQEAPVAANLHAAREKHMF